MSVFISSGTIAPDDRGFRYGDGVFETIRVENHKALLWTQHLARLQEGLTALSIPLDLQFPLPIARKLWIENGLTSGFLRIAISRGVGSQGYLPTATTPTVVIECLPPATPQTSVTLAVSQYQKISPKSLPTYFKTAQGLQSTLARLEAQTLGADDVVLLDAKANISETSSANVFWLKNNTLYTPSLATGALAGVTRAAVIETSPFPVQEGEYPLSHLQAAEAAFLTNARYGICPVAALLGRAFTRDQTWLNPLRAALQHHQTSHSAALNA